MSWPWHGQAIPPPPPPHQQPLPPPFPPVGHPPPPHPHAQSYPYSHIPPPPPFFNPPAPISYQPNYSWGPNPHGMAWQQHHGPVPACGNPILTQTEQLNNRTQPRNLRSQLPVHPQPLKSPAGWQNQKGKGKPGKKSEWPAKDMAMSKEVLRKLEASLPGESQAEIDKWVAERKRNWPSRANVARKLAEKKKREQKGAEMKAETKKRSRVATNSLTMLAAEYGSSDGEIDETEDKQPSHQARAAQKNSNQRGANGKRERGIGKKRQRGRRNVKKSNANVSTVPRRPSLLKMLLEKEIQQERNLLLQAFRYIMNRKRMPVSL